jgi:hypothetical protein
MSISFLRKSCFLTIIALGLVSGCGTPFKSQERLTLTAPVAGDELILDNNVGDVVVQADTTAKEVSAIATKVGRGSSANEAEKALEEIDVSLASDGEHGPLRAKTHQPKCCAFRNYSVSWKITAPPDLKISVTNDVGDVSVLKFRRDISVKNDVGNLTVTCDPAGSGNVNVATGVGNIRATDSVNGLAAKTDVGSIHASAGGAVDLRSNVGNVTLKLTPTAGKQVKASADVGDVTVHLASSQQGRLSADADVGSVSLGLEGVTLREFSSHPAHHASAQIGDASEPLITLSTDVGNVNIRSYSAPAAATSPAK